MDQHAAALVQDILYMAQKFQNQLRRGIRLDDRRGVRFVPIVADVVDSVLLPHVAHGLRTQIDNIGDAVVGQKLHVLRTL